MRPTPPARAFLISPITAAAVIGATVLAVAAFLLASASTSGGTVAVEGGGVLTPIGRDPGSAAPGGVVPVGTVDQRERGCGRHRRRDRRSRPTTGRLPPASGIPRRRPGRRGRRVRAKARYRAREPRPEPGGAPRGRRSRLRPESRRGRVVDERNERDEWRGWTRRRLDGRRGTGRPEPGDPGRTRGTAGDRSGHRHEDHRLARGAGLHRRR